MAESLRVPARVWRAAFREFLDRDFSTELTTLRVPTLVLAGDRDTFSRRHERDGEVHNLTTAATVWVTAALGIACALATWEIVWIGVGLTLVVLVLLHPFDTWIERRRAKRRGPTRP